MHLIAIYYICYLIQSTLIINKFNLVFSLVLHRKFINYNFICYLHLCHLTKRRVLKINELLLFNNKIHLRKLFKFHPLNQFIVALFIFERKIEVDTLDRLQHCDILE